MREIAIDFEIRTRREIAAAQPPVPSEADEAVRNALDAQMPYINRLRSENESLDTAIGVKDREIDRLERCLRVLRATAMQYAGNYPKWELFADMADNALRGERL
jgi:hypothetical protein